MAEMRLIVAGAGGRMGRTLIQAIGGGPGGVTLAGAVEAKGAAVIGRDAGELAGLGTNGVVVTAEVEPLLPRGRCADRLHGPGRHPRPGRACGAGRPRPRHRHDRPHRGRTTP